MANDFLDKYNKKAETVTQSIDISSNSTKPETLKPQTDTMSFTQDSGFTPPPKAPKYKNEKKFPIAYVAIPVVIVAIIVALVLLLGRGKTLPNMLSWTKSEAELWANENDVILRTELVFSDEVESNKIISQNPAEGEKVKKGEFLELKISSGPDYNVEVTLPDIKSMTAKEVETWASENHMEKVRVTYEESETIEAGLVISVMINDNSVIGDQVKRSSAIYVVFSSGASKGEAVEVPDFTTMTVAQAETFAEENKIKLTLNYEFNETYAKDEIYRQDIKEKETVNTGDTIVLTISKGVEVLVPNFYDYSRDGAALKASQLGITVIQEEKYSGYNKDALIYQSIKAGTLYNEGDFVVLRYSLGNIVELPSFVGQNESDLKSWMSEYNQQGASLSTSVTYTNSDKPLGTILTQDKENTNVSVSAKISLVVSKGPVLYTPNFVLPVGGSYTGIMTREKAIKICQELDVIPVFVEEKCDGRLEGEIWYQSIPAGTEIKQGDVITLKYVGVKTTAVVPDFTGMTLDDVLKAGTDKKFAIVCKESEYVEGMENKVVSQSVSKNSVLALGSVIEIYICPEQVLNINPDDTSTETSNEIPDDTSADSVVE